MREEEMKEAKRAHTNNSKRKRKRKESHPSYYTYGVFIYILLFAVWRWANEIDQQKV